MRKKEKRKKKKKEKKKTDPEESNLRKLDFFALRDSRKKMKKSEPLWLNGIHMDMSSILIDLHATIDELLSTTKDIAGRLELDNQDGGFTQAFGEVCEQICDLLDETMDIKTVSHVYSMFDEEVDKRTPENEYYFTLLALHTKIETILNNIRDIDEKLEDANEYNHYIHSEYVRQQLHSSQFTIKIITDILEDMSNQVNKICERVA